MLDEAQTSFAIFDGYGGSVGRGKDLERLSSSVADEFSVARSDPMFCDSAASWTSTPTTPFKVPSVVTVLRREMPGARLEKNT